MGKNSLRIATWHGRNCILLVVCFVGAMLTATRPAAAELKAPIGNWLTERHNAIISIGRCGDTLCGQIAGIPLTVPGEPIPTDNHGNSQCHLTIIQDGRPDGTRWRARITDPRDGSTYSVLLQLDTKQRLRVRGYFGIPLLGSTQVWTLFAAPLPADCRLPPLK